MSKDVFPNYPRAQLAHLQDGDPVGKEEMCQITGRSRPAVSKWIERYSLPPADGPVVHGMPTWRLSTFLAWAHEHDYLDTSPLSRQGQVAHTKAKMTGSVPRSVRELRASGELPAT